MARSTSISQSLVDYASRRLVQGHSMHVSLGLSHWGRRCNAARPEPYGHQAGQEVVLTSTRTQDGGPDLTETLVNHLGRSSRLISESGRLETLSRYGFPPLPSEQHIRVLLLSPARRWDHPLHGYLQIQDLNGRPHYEALSYTWSDETGDASLNRRLYAVVDLGEPSSGSDRALDCLNGITDKEAFVGYGDALNTLFRRPYFRRIWIIQEITSASQVEVTCGSRSADLRHLKNTTSLKPPWMAAFSTQIETFQLTGWYEGPEGLLRLLMDTRESESSDPRDKIFALLGLRKDYNKEGALVADYDFTYAQICTGLADYYLQYPGYQYIMCLRGARLPTLPSWVPNWGCLQRKDCDEFYNTVQNGGRFFTQREQWDSMLRHVKSLRWGDSLGIVSLQMRSSTSPPLTERPFTPRVHCTTGELIQEVAIS
ncbi:hypothetical protein PG994_000166 [Apiospora phragmitis]|uniref:Heterokaryon incompatibility domain-containing protein n=1 Tax=Apiospora phragmitis TaxID=2905665 RepID=A0ABR1X5I7_9PEZI